MSDGLDKTLHDLENKVSKYTITTKSPKISNFTGKISNVNIKVILIYGFIPASIIFILASWKPSFVRKEQEDNESLDNQLSFKKFTIAVLGLSLMLCGLLFMFLRKKEIIL